MKWTEFQIRDICDIVSGGTPNTADESLWHGKIPWITPADLSHYTNRYISYGERNISETGLKKSAAKLLPRNTVLLTSRAPIGYVKIAGTTLTTNQGFKNLICDPEKANYLFLYYWLSVNVETLRNYASGATFPELSAQTLGKIKITIPDLPTQEKIASILSAYDDAIENNNKRIKILEKMAENLYREWFVRMRFPGHETAEYENGLPKGWSVQKVGEIVSRLPFNKLYKKSDLLPDGNVIVVDQSAEEYIGFHNDEPSHFSDINHPIIIFGDHSCKYQLMTQNFSLGENVVPFTGKNCNTIFLFYAIRGIVTTTEYKRHWGELITKKILFPQIELQNKFAKMIAPCLQLERQLSSNNYNLTKQRNYQLLRLMSGKMEVTSR